MDFLEIFLKENIKKISIFLEKTFLKEFDKGTLGEENLISKIFQVFKKILASGT